MYSKSIFSVFYICLFIAVGQSTDTDNIVACTAVWTQAAEYWDAALNADSNAALLTSSLNSLGQLLTSDVYWTTPYTTTPVSGKTNAVNNVRNVEAPKISNSTRVTGAPRVLSTTLLEVQLSFLVTHYQTLVPDATNPLPRVFSQVERVTAKFRKPLLILDYSISSLSIVVVQNEEDDLIQEIIALRQQNQALAVQLNGYLAEDALSAQHRQTIQTVYDNVVYPNTIPIIQQGVLPHVFANNVKGRIHPVGTFSDLEGTIEYFYGLSPTSGDQRIVQANLVQFTSKGNIAASEVILYFQNPLNGTFLPNMTQKGFWRFDDDGLVVEFDLEILNLEMRQNALGRYSTNPAYRTSLINTICNTQAAICTGNNTQYASVAACVSFMNSIDFGTTDRYWANSVQCRSLHLKLASIRPAYHCPHVGPDGGHKCVDIDYNSLYQPLFPTQPRLIG